MDEFLQGEEGVSRLDASEVESKQGELPAGTKTVDLKSGLWALNRDSLSRVDWRGVALSQITIPLRGY